ncbi:MAG: peptidylprolyl isomerase [Cyclobacteriaceae bacterium]|nr:peptidylprolyl isomerase [Cyclobacteriaceae bacterium]UYN86026.1 MAG: peptidylprolyl isomerase [Cyclobacteriaceae bacterium]
MNRVLTSFLIVSFIVTSCAQKKNHDYVITIKTNYGDMVAILYDETPKHKANFIKLAKEKYYDSLLFHRVIEEFMIQGGDPNSKKAQPGQSLGNGGPGYTVDAEFNPKFFHEKGAFSAARLGDQANPTKASSGSQFYIVQGKKFSDDELTQLEQAARYNRKNQALREVLFMPEYESVRNLVIRKQQEGDGEWLGAFFEKSDTLIQKVKKDYREFSFSNEQKTRYKEVGGSPHLDGDYTVFGKVIKGLEVIDKIAAVQKGPGDRPAEDIRMFITVEEMPKAKIEKTYGYKYPESK